MSMSLSPSLRLVKEGPVSAPPPSDDPALTMARAFQTMLQEQERRLQAMLQEQEQRLRAAWREEHDRTARASIAREVLELPEWLTTAQVAEALGVALSTVRGRLQEERKRPEGERPLSACARPSARMRGRHAELEFNRDQGFGITL